MVLKTCPFCGGEARNYEGKIDAHGVCCKKCSAKIYGYASKAAATVPEYIISTPRFTPRLMPESIRS